MTEQRLTDYSSTPLPDDCVNHTQQSRTILEKLQLQFLIYIQQRSDDEGVYFGRELRIRFMPF